ncbi:unnamed protein product [Prorocentrum cordatum]|uniref:Uncharacterized protein n=1 Tax=Prorocentrum cordatum TaxID=2364126 RepID=A0ABN9V9I8_9DINO|nr:unnamed protein product [Polarella glacialis]
MTCCFCGCSLLGASVQLIALLTLWSYVQNIRLMADLCRPQSDGKRDSSCPIEQYELYCKQHNPPLSTNGQCYLHLQGRISHYSSLLTLSAVFSLPAIVLSCVAFCLGRRLWKEIRMGRVVVPLPGAAAPLARRAVQPAPAAQLAAPPEQLPAGGGRERGRSARSSRMAWRGFMTKLVDNAIKQAVDSSDTRWGARREVDAKIAESEQRTNVRFEDLMRRLTLVEKENQELKEAASTAGSAMGVGGGGGGGRSASGSRMTVGRQDFVARKVEVKGYITDWNKRNEQALTQMEMKTWVESLVVQVGDEAKAPIDVQATLNSGSRVLFTSGCYIRDIDPYVIVEPSPERRPYLQAGGRFLGYLEKHGVSKANVKAEWGPPLRVYDIRGARPAQLAKFDTSTGWSLQQAELESLIPNVKVGQGLADMHLEASFDLTTKRPMIELKCNGERTRALNASGLHWKPSRLEHMGSSLPVGALAFSIQQDGLEIEVPAANHIDMLGGAARGDGTTDATVEHRIRKATGLSRRALAERHESHGMSRREMKCLWRINSGTVERPGVFGRQVSFVEVRGAAGALSRGHAGRGGWPPELPLPIEMREFADGADRAEAQRLLERALRPAPRGIATPPGPSELCWLGQAGHGRPPSGDAHPDGSAHEGDFQQFTSAGRAAIALQTGADAFQTGVSGVLCEPFADINGGEVAALPAALRRAVPPARAVVTERGRGNTTKWGHARAHLGRECCRLIDEFGGLGPEGPTMEKAPAHAARQRAGGGGGITARDWTGNDYADKLRSANSMVEDVATRASAAGAALDGADTARRVAKPNRAAPMAKKQEVAAKLQRDLRGPPGAGWRGQRRWAERASECPGSTVGAGKQAIAMLAKALASGTSGKLPISMEKLDELPRGASADEHPR